MLPFASWPALACFLQTWKGCSLCRIGATTERIYWIDFRITPRVLNGIHNLKIAPLPQITASERARVYDMVLRLSFVPVRVVVVCQHPVQWVNYLTIKAIRIACIGTLSTATFKNSISGTALQCSSCVNIFFVPGTSDDLGTTVA